MSVYPQWVIDDLRASEARTEAEHARLVARLDERHEDWDGVVTITRPAPATDTTED